MRRADAAATRRAGADRLNRQCQRSPELDNLNTHRSAVMREFTAAHPAWLTVVQLPACAPELKGVWANMKNGLGNLATGTLDQLAATVRNRLRHIQRRPGLTTGFLGQTELTLEPQPP